MIGLKTNPRGPAAARLRAARYGGAALALLALAGLAGAAHAQPADLPIPAATTDKYPPGVRVARTPAGAVYTDSKGRVLYGMDMRTLLRWGPDPAQYCVEQCVATWEPLLAPAGTAPNIAYPRDIERARRDAQRASQGQGQGQGGAGQQQAARAPGAAQGSAGAQGPQQGRGQGQGGPPATPGFFTQRNAPDWTVIAGPQGPQWVYKGWHLVFIRRGDKPGSTAFDGADEKVWNTLKFVPPVPKITAPTNVQPVVLDGGYALADAEGRLLFTGKCAADCAPWRPFAAGMASAPIGEWKVSHADDTPMWTYRGQPVYVAQDDEPKQVASWGKPLRP